MANQAKESDERPLGEPEVFVGKDVLELLSSSMYVNPLASIYKTRPTRLMTQSPEVYCHRSTKAESRSIWTISTVGLSFVTMG